MKWAATLAFLAAAATAAILLCGPGLHPADLQCAVSPSDKAGLKATTRELLCMSPLYLAGLSDMQMAAAIRHRGWSRGACSFLP